MARLAGRLGNLSGGLKRAWKGFKDASGQGWEDDRRAQYAALEEIGEDLANMPSIDSRVSSHPGLTRLRTAVDRIPAEAGWQQNAKRAVQTVLPAPDKNFNDKRDAIGIGLSGDRAEAAGQFVGTAVNDATGDHSRSFWWLLNAPPAVASAVNDKVLKRAVPSLFKDHAVVDDATGKVLMLSKRSPVGREKARRMGLLNEEHRDMPKRGVSIGRLDEIPYKPADRVVPRGEADTAFLSDVMRRENLLGKDQPLTNEVLQGLDGHSREVLNNTLGQTSYLKQRNQEPGHVDALLLAPQVGLALGMGLNPLGGGDGYQAIVPEEADPMQSKDPIMEVGAKYILSRRGNLLPWNEYSQVRPDVSKAEYLREKAWRYNKQTDLNPFDDGKASSPFGAVKVNAEGLNGPSGSILGWEVPVNTSIIPSVSALAGTSLGARLGGRRHAIVGGLLGSAAGLAGGLFGGHKREDERRLKKLADRLPAGVDPRAYRDNSKAAYQRMVEERRRNPAALQQEDETKAAWGVRSQQDSLLEEARLQSGLVAQMIDDEKRARAEAALQQQSSLLGQVTALEP